MAEYTQYSRYIRRSYGEFRGNTVVFSEIDLNAIQEYEIYEIPVEHEYRPDLIALTLYGTSELWWVILQYNQLDHIRDLKVGKKIKVPIIPAGFF